MCDFVEQRVGEAGGDLRVRRIVVFVVGGGNMALTARMGAHLLLTMLLLLSTPPLPSSASAWPLSLVLGDIAIVAVAR
jgi:hypothetical protein